MRKFATMMLISLLAASASATVLEVSPDGAGTYATIKQAILDAAPGDTVSLTDGVFTGPDNRNLRLDGHEIYFTSVGGDPEYCILDIEGQGRGFLIHVFPGADITLENLTIRNGDPGDLPVDQLPGYGGAIAIENIAAGGTVRIRGCILEDNRAEAGGGAFLWQSEAVFTDCIFRGNVATDGSGGYCGNCDTGNGPIFESCLFYANDFPHPGVGGYGGGLYFSHSSGEVASCTFANNRAWLGAGLLVSTDSAVLVSSSLIAFNTMGGGVAVHDGAIQIAQTDIFGNTDGDWVGAIADQLGIDCNFSEDPLFCDAGSGDYTLNSESPCAPANNDDCGLIGALPIGCGPPSAVNDELPFGSAARLEPCTPNPFNPLTTIRFHLSAADRVTLVVYTLDGRRVTELIDAELPAGTHETIWSGRDGQGRIMPSGAYLCRLEAGGQRHHRRMLLLR